MKIITYINELSADDDGTLDSYRKNAVRRDAKPGHLLETRARGIIVAREFCYIYFQHTGTYLRITVTRVCNK